MNLCKIRNLWRTVFHEISLHFKAEGAAFISPSGEPMRLLWSEGIDGLASEYVREDWHDRNDRLKRIVSRSASRTNLFTERHIFDETEMINNPFNSDFIRRNGFGPFAGAMLYPSSSTPVVFSIERRAGRPEFDATELAGIRSILPHLQRALFLADTMNGAHASGMLDALDRIGAAAILLAASGKVLDLNSKARSLFDDAFAIEGGMLRARATDSRPRLKHLIAHLLGPKIAGGGTPALAVRIARDCKPPLLVQGAPLAGSPNEFFQSARAVLLISDPAEKKLPDPNLLQQILGLTAAESRVAVALAEGNDTTVIGESLRIKPETVRLHIKRLLQKTGTSRQVELVSTLKDFSYTIEDE